MANKDINIHVGTEGAGQAKQNLDGVAASGKNVGDKIGKGSKNAADGMNKTTEAGQKQIGMLAKLKTGLTGWVTGLVGVAALVRGITAAIRIQGEVIVEHARIATEQQNKLLALQFMGDFRERHPNLRKEVAAYAEFGRRPFEEVADAWYGLESKGAGLTEEQKSGIMKESLEFGRQEPNANLQSIVEMFSLYMKETGQKDANLVQNILRRTLDKAGADLTEASQGIPQFLSLGIAGGLSGAEAAGIWAYATTVGEPDPLKSSTAVRNIFMGLQGKGTPESQELLERLGVTSDMDFFQQLIKLSEHQKAGRFGVPEAEIVAGKENAAKLFSMLTNPQAMMKTVGEVTGAARGDIDLVKSAIDDLMATDEVARTEEDMRRSQIVIENIKGSNLKALRKQKSLTDFERYMRASDEYGPDWWIRASLGLEKFRLGIGMDPQSWDTLADQSEGRRSGKRIP